MKTKVWAHRGASAYAPENTMKAFELAVQQKADGVELDVQMTKDGKLVVIHDETIERVSDGSGYVKDFTLEELRGFQFNRTHPEAGDAAIPELCEVLALMKKANLTVNIELKTGIVKYPDIEKKVLELVKEMKMAKKVIYSSFHHKSLLKIKKLDAEAKTGLLYSDGWIGVTGYAKKLGIDALHPSCYHLRSKKLVESAKEHDLPLHVWTVDDKEVIRALAELRVAAVITNCPDTARDAIEAYIPIQ